MMGGNHGSNQHGQHRHHNNHRHHTHHGNDGQVRHAHFAAGVTPAEYTTKIPPAWNPEWTATKSFRQWCTELGLWLTITEVPPHAQAGIIVSRLHGTAKLVTNQLTPQQLTQGGMHNGLHLDPVTFLITQLQERFGLQEEEARLQAMMEMMSFHRKPGENTATFLMRYDLAREKAAVEGGYALNVETSAATLLNMLGPFSKERIQLLLRPTNYSLPRTEAEFRAMIDHIKQLARLEEHVPGNIADAINGRRPPQAFWANAEDGEDVDQSTAFMMNWGSADPQAYEQHDSSSSSNQYGWNTPCTTVYATVPAQPQQTSTYMSDGDGDSEFTSTSATSSDDGGEEIPIDRELAAIDDENAAGGHIYLQYRRSKRMWRRYTGHPVRKFRRKFKKFSSRRHFYGGNTTQGVHWSTRVRGGKGKGKGKGRLRFFHANSEDLQAFMSKGKGGKGSGKGFGRKGNPVGKDGKQLQCHQCGSTDHLIKNCPQKGAGGATMLANTTPYLFTQPPQSDLQALITGTDAVPNATGSVQMPTGTTLFTSHDPTYHVGLVLTEELINTPEPPQPLRRPQKQLFCNSYHTCVNDCDYDHTFLFMTGEDGTGNAEQPATDPVYEQDPWREGARHRMVRPCTATKEPSSTTSLRDGTTTRTTTHTKTTSTT